MPGQLLNVINLTCMPQPKKTFFLSLCLINVYKIWVDWNSIERVSYVHEVGLYKQTRSSVMCTRWQNLFIHLYKQTYG